MHLGELPGVGLSWAAGLAFPAHSLPAAMGRRPGGEAGPPVSGIARSRVPRGSARSAPGLARELAREPSRRCWK